ncbi:MAG: hypothetical protein JWQ98_53 [Chlorobi bacterium]|nr:hypothetical protein [Chlorobiota bacterium]
MTLARNEMKQCKRLKDTDMSCIPNLCTWETHGTDE